jgi:hypothetical protein
MSPEGVEPVCEFRQMIEWRARAPGNCRHRQPRPPRHDLVYVGLRMVDALQSGYAGKP